MESSARSDSLTRVAVYRRDLSASVDRVWENVRDWEHLPWLHSSSFSSIECLESGAWGWRARIDAGRASEIELELVIEPDAPRYVSRTLSGSGKGSEIWTSVEQRGTRASSVEVEFWMPGVDPARADALGAFFSKLYTQLWDEDEAMMLMREAELQRARTPSRELSLGPLDQVRARTPFCLELGGRPFRLIEIDGELIAHSARCPHSFGPLGLVTVEDGVVTCPWHGYRFDVRTRSSADGRALRLERAPRVRIDANSNVTLSLDRDGA